MFPIKKVKKENITEDNIGEIMLCQIPGISSVTSLAIMEKFKTISKHLSVSYTLSNVNIMYYQETVDWFNSQGLQFYHNLVTTPAYYNINSMPKSIKSDPAIAQFFREHTPSDDILFQKAVADLERQDKLKNIDCRNFVSKFTDLF